VKDREKPSSRDSGSIDRLNRRTSRVTWRPPTLLLATRSPGKQRELRPIFGSVGIRIIDLLEAGVPESAEEEEIEKFETFEENALAKARYFSKVSKLPTVADDSGLCVEALGGSPGVRSKRWSGRTDLRGQALDDANNAKLVESVSVLPEDQRAAHYVCAAAFVDAEVPIEVVRRGESRGRIILEPRGKSGFGYDPYFFSADLGMTFAEATIEVKEAVSHRGRAFRALVAALHSLRSDRTAR
jgi:XTP/dITP diphosphohydrolase